MKKTGFRVKKFKKCLQSRGKCAIIQWFGKPSKIEYAPLAQMDRAQASDAWCRRFESAMVRQQNGTPLVGVPFCSCILVSMRKRTQKIPFSADEARIGFCRPVRSLPLAAKFGSESAMVRQEKSTAQAVLFSIQSEGLAWNLTAGEHDIAAGVWHHAPACISLRIDSIRLQASDSIRRFAPIPSTPSA